MTDLEGKMTDIKLDKTSRNFDIGNFIDECGVECSIQKSSRADDGFIWLGCDRADPRVLIFAKGWTPIEMPAEYIANTRMHLSREHVGALLPLLQSFVATGELNVKLETSKMNDMETMLDSAQKRFKRHKLWRDVGTVWIGLLVGALIFWAGMWTQRYILRSKSKPVPAVERDLGREIPEYEPLKRVEPVRRKEVDYE